MKRKVQPACYPMFLIEQELILNVTNNYPSMLVFYKGQITLKNYNSGCDVPKLKAETFHIFKG